MLALLGSVGLLGFLGLALHARSASADEATWSRGFTTALADTDSVVVSDLADSLRAAGLDTLVSDTTETDTTRRAQFYFPTPRLEGIGAPLVDRLTRPYQFDLGAYWRREVLLDSTDFSYTITERVAGQDVRIPVETDLPDYREARLQNSITQSFRELAARRGQQQRRGLLDVTIDIPGGRDTPFATIFGKNEVNLRVNGQANIDLGFDYQTNELDQAVTGRSGTLNPDFGQELSLGITGTIGDKLRVNVNYDTQNQFDFENQVSLVYEGYDDDIIQRIEAGNVFLQTPSELIRGGQRLFGLRTDLQFGGLNLTAVASQQDAESDALVIEGGSQTTTFDIQPYEYENNTHFFLGYHFYNWWDRGHSNPTNPTINAGLQRITGIEVWLHDNAAINGTTAGGGIGGAPGASVITYATALVDLAEPGPGAITPGAPPRGVLDGGDAYLAALGSLAPLPDSTLDQYTPQDLALLRDSSSTINLEADFDLRQGDFETRAFRKLEENVDYTVDPFLGYISLRRALTENEVIAVSYQYLRANGSVVTVGDFGQGSTSGSTNGDRIVLKLLRGSLPVPNDASWALTMRNIYRVGGRSLQADAFELDLFWEPNGSTPQTTLPGVNVGQQQTLLQTIGLNRLNQDGIAQPDDAFDFTPLTIDAGQGRVIFPNREPFGAHLRNVLQGNSDPEGGDDLSVSFQGISQDAALQSFVFDTLYSLKPDVARQRFPNLDNYVIAGEYRSSVQSIYELGFAIVEGSVVVTSGNQPLTEGVDYTVNYASGTVEIVNQAYLTPGQNLKIDYERNQFAAIGSKTLLGLRADYSVGDNFGVGATWMRLNERPLIDKYRIGEEPLSNTIFGFDGRYQAEPRWLTRAVDALPLIQTRAPSRFEFKGEFAQLLPGHPETFAFNLERNSLRDLDLDSDGRADGRDFYDDELNGLSFIDDFEGVENSFSLMQPGAWLLASAPTGSGPSDAMPWSTGTPITAPTLPSNWRGVFAWYTLNRNLYENGQTEILGLPLTQATRPVSVREVFPQREVRSSESDFLSTLDLYIDPTNRGPYNYNGELQTTFANTPQTAWGGMAQRLPEGYTDFGGRNNVEFVEFIFSPLGGRNGTETIAPGAVLYVDLGSVSEDVIPNRQFNQEDGLRENPPESSTLDAWGRLPDGQSNNRVDINQDLVRTEDLGLDGLRSRANLDGGDPYFIDERSYFEDFIQTLTAGSSERITAEEDPSADDYHYFEEDGYFNDGNRFEGGRATVQERFSRFFPGLELNAFESQSQILGGGTGNSRLPDSEDLNGNQSLDLSERHYRYAVPLDEANLRASPFFQSELVINTTEGPQSWFLVRIPVRSQDREAIGGIEDFSLIESIRLWTTGHDKPATLRFASLELVGSQWLKSERVGIEEPGGPRDIRTETRLFIETINNEENPTEYAIPVGAIVSRTPDLSGNLIRNNEQAIVFRAENLAEGASRAIYKPLSTNRLDLTKYSNLRMFVHGEGFERRDSVRAFIRLGSNETEDYYEYEQILYPFEPADLPPGENLRQNPDSLWQTNVPIGGGQVLDLNSINVILSELNKLKVERDNNPDASLTERYEGLLQPEGSPPGTRLYIRGTPSIQSISTVVLGVRNGQGGTTAPLENVEVWFNELRVSGYDEQAGWSAYARTTLQLADLATLNARFSRQTDGFGDLGSGLGDRIFSNQQDVSLIASLNAHKLLPERFGWNMPISVSVQQSESTPRFAPRRGDIRVEELIAQAEEDPTLTGEERQARIESIREESETNTFTRSVRVPLSKSGSASPWLRYTLDGLSLVYTNTASRQRTPSVRFNDSDRWSSSVTYRLTVPRPKTVRPFWFTENVPILGVLGDLRLNVLPQSFSFIADANRTNSRNQQRPTEAALADTTLIGVPQNFLFPTRRDHTFGHGRTLDLAYNPFTFLNLSYRSDVTQSLSSAGADEAFRLFVRDTLNNITRQYDLSRAEAFDENGGPACDDFGLDCANPDFTGLQIFEVRDLDILPVGEVVGEVFSGERRVLTDNYTQNFTASFSPRFDRIRALSWIRPQPITYGAQFSWAYTPPPSGQTIDELILAGVQTSATIRAGLQLRPRDFWRLFPFYQRLEEQEQQARNQPDRGGRDTQPRPAGNEDAEDAEDDETADEGGGLPINLGAIGRKLFLALTGVEDLTVTYSGTRSAAAGGLQGEGYSLLGGLTGNGPSLGYRLGLNREIPIDDRFVDPLLQYTDNLGDNHRLNARTTLRLTPDLNVNLTWDTNWNRNQILSFGVNDATMELERLPSTERGSGNATILSLGGSYDRLLELQEDRFRADIANPEFIDEDGQFIRSEALTRTGVTEDFRSAFVRDFGAFGESNLLALPLPNWDVTFSGLARWPLFRAFAQQVSLRHSYFATYDLSYLSNAAAGTTTTPRFLPNPAGGLVGVASETPFREPTTAVVNERFQPLIGVDVTWKGGFQTNVSWNQTNSYALAAATASLTEGNTEELSLRLSFSRTGLRLPFARRRLNNNVRFTLTLSRTDREDATRFLQNDLEDLLSGNALAAPQITGSRRLTVEPRLSYAVSNQVNMDVFVRYEKVDSQGGQVFASSNLNGGFSFRLSFSN